jgi:hypothetical protein
MAGREKSPMESKGLTVPDPGLMKMSEDGHNRGSENSSYLAIVNALKKLNCKMKIAKSSLAWISVFILHFSNVNFQFSIL